MFHKTLCVCTEEMISEFLWGLNQYQRSLCPFECLQLMLQSNALKTDQQKEEKPGNQSLTVTHKRVYIFLNVAVFLVAFCSSLTNELQISKRAAAGDEL